MVDKNQAVINFLIDCPQLRDNPLFFNFVEAKDNNKQLLVLGNEKSLNTTFIDGSVMKRYTFTIIDYRSVAYQAIVKDTQHINENVEELLDVQGIIDWISNQEDLHNYPDFGEKCQIESMTALTDNPNLNGVDSSTKPSLAKYSFSIRIDYLDTSKRIWN